MSNKLLVWLSTLGLVLHISACSSNEEKSDVEAATEIEAGDGSSAVAAGDDAGAATPSEALPEEALGTDGAAKDPAASTADAAPPSGDLIMDGEGAAPTDISANPTGEPPSMVSEPTPSTVTEAPPPAAAETKPLDESTAPMSTASMEEKPKPAPAPLQKMAMKPWKVGKTWFNGIYFARPGDTLASISQTIYGSDKTAQMKKGNPSYKSREPKAGDKVYYNSPTRPEDSERMLTYFEDTGAQPETYVAKKGDNIRKVAKNLLGYDGAWKEVWSSNLALESKGALEEGTELKYWKGAPAAAPAQASTNAEVAPPNRSNAEAPAAPPEMPPPTQAMNEMPPPPPHEMAPPPPPPDLPPPPPPPPEPVAAAPPPPPPPQEMAPPPPPPPPIAGKAKGRKTGEEETTAMDEETMMTLGAVALAAAGIAALLVRRRRKAKEMEAQIGETTHVGT